MARIKYLGTHTSYTIDRYKWNVGDDLDETELPEQVVNHALSLHKLFKRVEPAAAPVEGAAPVKPKKGALKLKSDKAGDPPVYPTSGYETKQEVIDYASQYLGLTLDPNKSLSFLNETAYAAWATKYNPAGLTAEPEDDTDPTAEDIDDDGEIDTGVAV